MSCIQPLPRVGGLDLGLVPGPGGLDALAMAKAGALDVLFNLGADEIEIEPGAFVVYIGTHGDRGANRADVILPGAPPSVLAPLRAQHLPGRQISIHLRARPGASAIAHQAWGGAEFREIEAPVMQHQCQNVKLSVGPYGQ